MTLAVLIWRWRYAAEERRRLAAGQLRYVNEAGWCLLLALLGGGRRP